MEATLEVPRPTHREEQPVRSCRECGAYLRSFTNRNKCDPCSTPEDELVEPDDWYAAAVLADACARWEFFCWLTDDEAEGH